MQLAANAGLRTIVLSAVWKQGATAASDLPPLRRAVRAAKAQGIEPQLAVYQLSSSTPLDDAARTAFSEYAVALVKALPSVRTVLVGNEPNLNLFWMPQFDSTRGDAAATAYEQLLAVTYDALKSADANVTVVGGEPGATRRRRPDGLPSDALTDDVHQGHGRRVPRKRTYKAADGHVLDPRLRRVAEDPAVVPPPRTRRSIGIADYDKLVSLLGQAFDGTAQAGSKLPIVYGEYGVETTSRSQARYTGAEVVPDRRPQTQAATTARRSSSPRARRTCARSTSST